MEATYGTNRKVKKLGLQDCIPKMPTAQGGSPEALSKDQSHTLHTMERDSTKFVS